jgi:protoporphyrinogen oxidase
VESIRTLIVGGGVSGLAFANFTSSAADQWLVLEREQEAGGYCRTIQQDGFVWDFSGHFFHFRDPTMEGYLRDRMPADSVETIVKSSGVLFDGVRIDFPFQKNIHQLPKEHFLACLHDLYFLDTERTVDSFKDMLYTRLGKGICERFLIPYNEKLYACDLDRLDADAMGRFFPHAKVDDIIRNFVTPDNQSYNAAFTYPRGGAIEYIRALLHDLPDERVSLGESLVALDPEARIATTSKRTIQYENVISSMPFNRLLAMANVPHDSTIYSANKVLVFNLGFDRKGPEQDHWLYIPHADISFYRVGFYDNIFHTDRMSLYIEIGLPSDAEVGDLNPWLERVLADLETLGISEGHKLVSWHSVVLDPAYVHITKDSQTDVAEKKAWLAERGIHSIGRYGSWTYCSIEDNMLEARALAEELG